MSHTYTTPRKLIGSPQMLYKVYHSKWFVAVGGLIRDIFKALEGAAADIETKEAGSQAETSEATKSPPTTTQVEFETRPTTVTSETAQEEGKRSSTSTTTEQLHPVCQELVGFLAEAKTWIAEIPLVQQASRFGNLAFRAWFDRMRTHALQWMSRLIEVGLPLSPTAQSSAQSTEDPNSLGDANILSAREQLANELCGYFQECFGNWTRIDYGTGHELAFVAFLAALKEAGLVGPGEYRSLGLHVFDAYLHLVRELQIVYMLEPAGSKGAWGLDDYQFMPFLWGTAQFLGSKTIPLPAIVFNDSAVRQRWTGKNLLVDAINFVQRMKTGPLEVHSPYLCTLSKVPSWERAARGLFKMYGGEVLSKFPVMQHVFFGSLLTLDPVEPQVGRSSATALDVSTPTAISSEAKDNKSPVDVIGVDPAAPLGQKPTVHQLVTLFGIPFELTYPVEGLNPMASAMSATRR